MKFSNYIFLSCAFLLGTVASIGLAQDRKQEAVQSNAATSDLTLDSMTESAEQKL